MRAGTSGGASLFWATKIILFLFFFLGGGGRGYWHSSDLLLWDNFRHIHSDTALMLCFINVCVNRTEAQWTIVTCSDRLKKKGKKRKLTKNQYWLFILVKEKQSALIRLFFLLPGIAITHTEARSCYSLCFCLLMLLSFSFICIYFCLPDARDSLFFVALAFDSLDMLPLMIFAYSPFFFFFTFFSQSKQRCTGHLLCHAVLRTITSVFFPFLWNESQRNEEAYQKRWKINI